MTKPTVIIEKTRDTKNKSIFKNMEISLKPGWSSMRQEQMTGRSGPTVTRGRGKLVHLQKWDRQETLVLEVSDGKLTTTLTAGSAASGQCGERAVW
uniref:Uncharacterized protein n=1 Tax=Prolemur simus TaxID=1328070 RepID=A0A8C8ZSE8_PROSS